MSKGKSFKDTLKYIGTCFTMECYPFAPHPCDRQSQEAVSPEISWSASSIITARQQGQKENSSHKTIFNATFHFILFFFFCVIVIPSHLVCKTKENMLSLFSQGKHLST